MSSVHDVVRGFLETLERGEGSAEDRSLADQLAWWASGWRARGQRSSENGAVVPVGIPLSGAVVVEEFPYQVVVGRPPRAIEVVARVVAPPMQPVRLAPGAISPEDRKFADDLLGWDGKWVVVDCSMLTMHQAEWLAKKINGQGAAYRPVGSFQAIESLGSGRIYARAVDELAPPRESRDDLLTPPLGNRTTSPGLDEKLVATLLAKQGKWFEFDVAGLSRARVRWLQDKISGSGQAYRPAGSFETRHQDGGLWVRAVPGGAGTVDPPRNTSHHAVGAAKRRSPVRNAAPERAVAVLIPPVPVDTRQPGVWVREVRQEVALRDQEFAAEIRSYKGEWVEIEVSEYNTRFAFNLSQKISKLGMAFRPAGSFEATVRGGRLYARYLGAPQPVPVAVPAPVKPAPVVKEPALPTTVVVAPRNSVGRVWDAALSEYLVAHPGWVDVSIAGRTTSSVSWTASKIRAGRGEFKPRGAFEVDRTQQGRFRARYVGESTSDG